MTGRTGTQASYDDDYEFPGLPASPALDVHYEASQAIVNDARRQGTLTRAREDLSRRVQRHHIRRAAGRGQARAGPPQRS